MSPPFSPFDRLLAHVGVRWLIWIAFCAVLLEGVLRIDPHMVSAHYDEHYFFAQDDITRITIADFGELPGWNPYFCGGIPAAANPQSQAFAPDFLLRLAFGTGPGRRLATLLFVLLGLEGMYLLARRHGATRLGGIAAAFAFAASGRFYFGYQFGWINMFGFQLLPWAVLGYEQAGGSWRYAILGGAALGWMALAGGTYSLPFSVLTLVALAIWDTGAAIGSREHGRIRDPILALVRIGLFTALFAAAKLVPMFAVVFEHPRTWTEPSVVGPINVIESLLLRGGGGHYSGESYLGGFLIIAAIIPLFLRDAKVIRPLAVAGLFFALAMGNLATKDDVSLYSVVHALPVYSQLRNPERFTFIVCFFLALAIGRLSGHIEGAPLALAQRLRERFRPKAWTPGRIARFVTGTIGGLGAVAFLFGVAFNLVVANRVSTELFAQDPPLFFEGAAFRQSRGNRWDAQVWPRAALGTLLCFDENPYPQSAALRGDLPAEEHPEDPSLATVKRIGWTPNSITLQVQASSEARVLVNQNHHRGWHSNVGRVDSKDGLLSVIVPAGEHVVRLRYRSTLLYVGVWITTLTLVGLGALGLRILWKRKKKSKATASPVT